MEATDAATTTMRSALRLPSDCCRPKRDPAAFATAVCNRPSANREPVELGGLTLAKLWKWPGDRDCRSRISTLASSRKQHRYTKERTTLNIGLWFVGAVLEHGQRITDHDG